MDLGTANTIIISDDKIVVDELVNHYLIIADDDGVGGAEVHRYLLYK